jgi:hypothetical protein
MARDRSDDGHDVAPVVIGHLELLIRYRAYDTFR